VDGLQVNSLDQLRLFACTVAAPLLASWAIQRAFAARLQVTDTLLVLDQPHQRIEIPLASLGTLRPWRPPWPHSGIDLTLASGRRWPLGIQLADPAALLRVLSGRGSPARWSCDADALVAGHAGNRARFGHRWLDHAVLKFGLFPLLPALPAFRLHQVIAYGGPLGEYYTYGFTAWLGGLLIWWAAWSLGLMLYAAALRVVGELVNLLVMGLAHPSAPMVRRITEWACRAAFYLGAPGWLLLRIVAA
jgi:apolipoprotein N-acyltransferase